MSLGNQKSQKEHLYYITAIEKKFGRVLLDALVFIMQQETLEWLEYSNWIHVGVYTKTSHEGT
jgi:hypothetical protein